MRATRYLVIPALLAFAACGDDGTGPSNNSPTASFTFTPVSPTSGQAVSFVGTGSSDSDGTIANYSWDFGDGGMASGPNATHTYASGGTFSATLTVRDDDNATATATQQVVVAPSMAGIWQGTIDVEGSPVTVNMALTENNGAVSGTGSFQASGGSLAFTVTGTHPHPSVSLTIQASGFEDSNYTATFSGNNTVTGTLNGSGFTDDPLTLNRQ